MIKCTLSKFYPPSFTCHHHPHRTRFILVSVSIHLNLPEIPILLDSKSSLRYPAFIYMNIHFTPRGTHSVPQKIRYFKDKILFQFAKPPCDNLLRYFSMFHLAASPSSLRHIPSILPTVLFLQINLD